MIPLKMMLPTPVVVSRNPPLLMVPLNVKAPASDAMVEADPSVTGPLQEFVPLMLPNAPSFEMPLPFNVNVSAPTKIPFKICNAAPLATVVPDAVVPNAVELCIFRTPALINVAPVNVLSPVKVHVPVPVLVRVPAPVPMMLEMLPLPEPVKVNPNPEPVIVPVLVRFSVPLSDEIVLAPPSVSSPP